MSRSCAASSGSELSEVNGLDRKLSYLTHSVQSVGRAYTEELLREAVAASTSFAGLLRYLGLRQAGGTQAHIARRVRHFGIDTSHFLGQAHARGTRNNRRLKPEQVLVVRPAGSLRAKAPILRRALIESGRAYLCEHCGLDPGDVPVTLHVDHIDGATG